MAEKPMATRLRFRLVDIFLVVLLLSAIFALTRNSWKHMLALSVVALAVVCVVKSSASRRARIVVLVHGLVTFLGGALGFFLAIRYYPDPNIWLGIRHHLARVIDTATSSHGGATNLDWKAHLLFMASYYEAVQGEPRFFLYAISGAVLCWLLFCTVRRLGGIHRSLASVEVGRPLP